MNDRPVQLASFATFGDLLRYLRKRARLSQRELAIAVGYSEAQISRLESNLRSPDNASLLALFVPSLAIEDEPETIARFTELAQQNRGNLGVRARQESDNRTGERDQAEEPEKQYLHNLPVQLTFFIGRKKEVAFLRKYLTTGTARLVTVTGAGGIGKTRLALRACEQIVAAFPDGVWLVDLAPVRDPNLVAKTVAQALGLEEMALGKANGVSILETLSNHLRNRRLLLILDNCEHLLTECARLVDALLRACPALRILATSREILHVPGEYPFWVPSMALADPQALPSIKQLRQVEAVRLFAERAAQAAPGFGLNRSNAYSVALICKRLDGIPLAIELAVARLRVMDVEQIAARLNDIFHLLTGGARTVMPRQQTLKATIDWSYDLLSSKEQQVLQRLSVFAGGWTLEGAEAVCQGEGIEPSEVLDLTTGLVDKSLVMPRAGEGRASGSFVQKRYHMLETIRQYAREKLANEKLANEKLANEKLPESGGSAAQTHSRHASYYVSLGEEAWKHLSGQGQQVEWLNYLDKELDNLRLALDWALLHPDGANRTGGLYLIYYLERFWYIRHSLEGLEWAKRMLEAEAANRDQQLPEMGWQNQEYALGGASAGSLARCCAVITYARLAYSRGSPEEVEQAFAMLDAAEQVCHLFGKAADKVLAHIIYLRGYCAEDPAEGNRFFEEAITMAQQVRHPLTSFFRYQYLAYQSSTALNQANIEQAQAYLEESLAAAQDSADLESAASYLCKLGKLCYYKGAYARGKNYFKESFKRYQETRNRGFGYQVDIDRFLFLSANNERDPEIEGRAAKALAFFQETRDFSALQEALHAYLVVEWNRGNFARVAELGRERTDVYRIFHHDHGEHATELWLGRAALTQKDLPRARQHLRLAARLICSETDQGIISWIALADALAVSLASEGEMERAAALFGAVEEKYRSFHLGFPLRQRTEHDQALASIRQTLGEDRFTATWEEGRAMTVDQAIQCSGSASGDDGRADGENGVGNLHDPGNFKLNVAQ